MSADAKLACNRLPFQTDDSCSRGDVDITVFKDLPICLPINPTEPKGGVPQTDIPVIPITPPPCACVNIDMSGSGKVEDRKKKDVEVKTEFKSVGDCCEGNYKANVKVNIPCMPFSLDDKTKNGKKLNITTDCEIDEASGSVKLGITSADCKLTFDPQITLKLPKPKEYDIEPVFKLTNECGSVASGSFSMDIERDKCSVKFKPKLRLNIPPIPHLTTCSSGQVEINPCASSTAGSMQLNPEYDSCSNLKKFCPTLKLNLACPIGDIGRDSWNDSAHPPIKIGANVSMADPCDNCFPAKKPLSIPHCNCKNFVGKQETEAEREKFPTCCAYHCGRYVPGASALRECKGKWDCGCCANFVHYWKPIPWPACFCDEEVIVERDPDSCCKLSVPKIQKTIRLGVPCPVALPTTVRAKAKLKWLEQDSSYKQSASMPLLWNNSSSCICDLETYSASAVADSYPALKLGLPCPVKFPEPVKTRIHVQFVQSVAGNYDVSASILDHDPDPRKCGFSVKNNQITLRIPTGGGGGGGGVCPVWVSDVKFDLSRGAGLRLIKVYTDCDGNQWEEEGSKLGMKEISVVSASTYSDGTFKNTKKTVWVLDSEDALDEDVFYAVEHACCD